MRGATLLLLSLGVLLQLTHGFVVRSVDPFPLSSVVYSQASHGQGPTDPDPVWYSPYYGVDGSGGPPAASGFLNHASILGGQRDSVIGYYTTTSPLTASIIPDISSSSAPCLTAAFPLTWVGGVYIQYDGLDAVSSEGSFPTFPGAVFNAVPGLGGDASGVTNGIDLTMNGQVSGLTLGIDSDQLVNYYLDVIDGAGNDNHFALEVPIVTGEFRYFGFHHANWTNPSFDWTNVAGLQVRIWTYSPGEYVVRPGGDGPDTSFYYFNLVGWTISGTVYKDCGCTGTSTTLSPNRQRIVLKTADGRHELARVYTTTGYSSSHPPKPCWSPDRRPRCACSVRHGTSVETNARHSRWITLLPPMPLLPPWNLSSELTTIVSLSIPANALWELRH